MWVFTTDGFYSAVMHREDQTKVMVRCRKEADAKALAVRLITVLPDMPAEVKHTPEGDYAYRLVVPREAWAWYLWQFAMGLDYPNFKNAVAERQGLERADIYHDVWATMWEYQTDG